jgi:ABC-2 type transport system permease protein
MGSFIVRTLAFCRKELSSSARQPLKVLGLVLGPFIILAIFATGYDGSNKFDTALVVPDRPGISTNPADYSSFSKQTFNIVEVSTNQAAEINKLKEGKLGVVIVVPDNALDQIYSGRSAQFPVYYRQLSPLQANYIEYNTYVYASEFDKVLLREALAAAKPPNDQVKTYGDQLNSATNQLQQDMQANNVVAAKADIVRLQAVTALTRQGTASLIIPGNGKDNSQQAQLIARQVSQGVVGNLNNRVAAVDAQVNAINDGLNRNDTNSSQQQQNLAKLKDANNALISDTSKIANIPAAVLVEPVLSQAKNLASTGASFLNFYAPAVVILLLQHIGVTLAALSIVRDRMLGALEIFRVSPINPTEILIGKFLSYMILLMVVSGLLIAALHFVLAVPFIGDPLLAVGVIASSSFASIGLGFLIAGLARTETQAVQWSMLLILASLFFTGFIVPLNQFSEYVRYFSYILPMTFGATNLQDVMLDNRFPDLFYLLMPLGLGLLYFTVGRFLYKRQFSLS